MVIFLKTFQQFVQYLTFLHDLHQKLSHIDAITSPGGLTGGSESLDVVALKGYPGIPPLVLSESSQDYHSDTLDQEEAEMVF